MLVEQMRFATISSPGDLGSLNGWQRPRVWRIMHNPNRRKDKRGKLAVENIAHDEFQSHSWQKNGG